MISNSVWDEIYECTDADKAYKVFDSKINTCFEACFPLVKFKLSRKVARDKRWMTPGLKVCSNNKNKLYKILSQSGYVKDEQKYKNYRKLYNKVIAEAENICYREQFDTKSNSVKQLWTNLNQIFSLSKPISNVKIPKLTVNGEDLTDPKDICNSFNSYFCSVGKKLVSRIIGGKNEFTKYCMPL